MASSWQGKYVNAAAVSVVVAIVFLN